MSAPGAGPPPGGVPPQWPARLLRRLLAGPRGAEACAEIEEEFRVLRARRSAVVGWIWYVIQVLRPGTWVLAAELRSVQPPRRSTGFAGFSWLDVKLGLRMLWKYPGMSLVAVFGLAVGIPVALSPVHVLDALWATLPFEEGERIVGLRHWNTATASPVMFGPMIHGVLAERGGLESFEAIGAAMPASRNLVSADGRGAPVLGAAVTASTFELLRVRPLLGRVLTEADEARGAPDVVLLGYAVWQARFAGDRNIIGRTVHVGAVPHTVVGVMPEGFLFPVRQSLWLPLRIDPALYSSGRGPSMLTYGRLAPGVAVERAQAELEALGAVMAAEHPETHGRLRPEVVPYWRLGIEFDDERLAIVATQLAMVLLLAVICGNVAMLVLARTASRTGEIAIRTALGASRARVVGQIFLETLIPALLATGIGLAVAHRVAVRFQPFDTAPFWFDMGVNGRTVALALGLAAFSAVLAGVVPALRATGSGVGANLRRAAGGGGIRFGRGSTLLIVVDVTMAVILLFVGLHGADSLGVGATSESWLGIRADEFVAADVRLPYVGPPPGDDVEDFVARRRARMAHVQQTLAERLRAEPGVRAVAVARELPGMYHEVRRIEIEGEGNTGARSAGDRSAPQGAVHRVREALVDAEFFRALEQPILRGRDFTLADATAGAPSVIVNDKFVRDVLAGADPLGRRLRYVGDRGQEPGPWHEVVGVVGPLGMKPGDAYGDAGVYRVAVPGTFQPRLAVRVSGSPAAFIPRLREIAVAVDPEVMIENPTPLDDLVRQARWWEDLQLRLAGALAFMSVLFAAAGLYALMSFLVAQRTREIGIRTALGAGPRQILWAVGARAVGQLSLGVALGVTLVWAYAATVPWGAEDFDAVGAGILVVGAVVLVGVLACVPPTLRGLRVEPTEALREG